jgi:hypothetical protein
MLFLGGGGAYSLFYIKNRMTPERTRPKQNQSEIAKKRWNSKHMKVEECHSLKAERDRLLIEVETLKQEKEVLVS